VQSLFFPLFAVRLIFAAICVAATLNVALFGACHITSKLNYGHADASANATNKLSINAAQKYTKIHWEKKERECS